MDCDMCKGYMHFLETVLTVIEISVWLSYAVKGCKFLKQKCYIIKKGHAQTREVKIRALWDLIQRAGHG